MTLQPLPQPHTACILRISCPKDCGPRIAFQELQNQPSFKWQQQQQQPRILWQWGEEIKADELHAHLLQCVRPTCIPCLQYIHPAGKCWTQIAANNTTMTSGEWTRGGEDRNTDWLVSNRVDLSYHLQSMLLGLLSHLDLPTQKCGSATCISPPPSTSKTPPFELCCGCCISIWNGSWWIWH